MLYKQILGTGQDLVLLHGWGMNQAVWENIATNLAANFKLTVIDLPGHGYSSFATTNHNLLTWAEACLRIAPPQAIWLGWSLGGTIALAAALAAPNRLQKLVLMTATPCFLHNANWPHGMQREVLARFRNTLATNWAETVGNFLTLQVRDSKDALPVLRSLRQCLAKYPPPNPAALDVGLAILKNTDLSQQIANLTMPNLWIYGNRDTLVSCRSSETLTQLLPSAQISIIQGAAHAPFLSHTDQVLDLLRKFIKSPTCQT